jgi:hypothetical protein
MTFSICFYLLLGFLDLLLSLIERYIFLNSLLRINSDCLYKDQILYCAGDSDINGPSDSPKEDSDEENSEE